MDKMSINQRFTSSVDYLISSKKVKSKKEISEFLELKPSTFSEILKNRSGVSAEVIAVFCEKYEINPIWLLTGQGNMLKNEVQKEVSAPITGQNTSILEQENAFLKRENELLNAQIKDKEEKEALYKDKIQRLERELKEYQKSSAIYTGQRQNIQPTL